MSAGIDIGASGALSRARALMRQGALDAADTIVNDALARAPRDADALYLRGAIANLRRDHAAAVVVLREAVAIRPTLTTAWLELANAYARLDQCVARPGPRFLRYAPRLKHGRLIEDRFKRPNGRILRIALKYQRLVIPK